MLLFLDFALFLCVWPLPEILVFFGTVKIVSIDIAAEQVLTFCEIQNTAYDLY